MTATFWGVNSSVLSILLVPLNAALDGAKNQDCQNGDKGNRDKIREVDFDHEGFLWVSEKL